jgi:hypothetical protein
VAGVLNLSDALAKIGRARELHEEFTAALKEWQDTGGVEAQSRRSLQFVCYIGYVKVNTEPPINLPLRAGEILHALRTALDYIAFQIYLTGGGAPDGDKAHLVEFPIVDDPAKWDRVVQRKVPGAWPAAIAELRDAQQFAPPTPDPPPPLPPIAPLLSRLRTLGGTDKHRNLSLFTTGAWSASLISPPDMQQHYRLDILIYTPGPQLPTTPGQKVAVSRVSVNPSFAPHPDDVFTWKSGIQFERPDPPQISFGFRANDGTQIDTTELPTLTDLVESITQRFEVLPAP